MRTLRLTAVTSLALLAASSGAAFATTQSAPTVSVHVYYLHGEKVASVHRDAAVSGRAVATAAMTALLAGPTSAEQRAGIATTIPRGTRLNSVSVSNGTADVDLSSAYASGGGSMSMTGRLMQVVFTLTQFPTVHDVTFRINGKRVTTLGGEGVIIRQPQSRANYTSFLPRIFIDSPARGETISSPVTVTGLANVFEGQFSVEIRDASGHVVVRRPANAAMGKFASFRVSMPFVAKHGAGRVIGFDLSPKNGARVNVNTVPVTLQ